MTLPVIKWTPSPNFSSRGGQKTRLIVVHDCEGGYLGSIAWLAMPRSQVSAHMVLSEDGTEATQMVAWGNKAWHACNVNPFSEGIEAAGFQAKGFSAAEWQALAELVAWRLHANNIPCQEATAANNWTGFTQHVYLGAMGGNHHDITEDPKVWGAFVARVFAAYNNGAVATPPKTNADVPVVPPTSKPSETDKHDEEIGSLTWTQMRLNAHGAKPTLIVDGIDGPATESALIRFQKTHGLVADGIIGPKTIKALTAL